MKLFVVIKQGAYRHEIGGVFDSEVLATEAAIQLREGESDDYHSYVVIPTALNKITFQEGLIAKKNDKGHKYFSGGELVEEFAVFHSGTKE